MTLKNEANMNFKAISSTKNAKKKKPQKKQQKTINNFLSIFLYACTVI